MHVTFLYVKNGYLCFILFCLDSKGSESAVEHFDREASQESLQVKESSINHQHDENASLKSQVSLFHSS